MGVISYADDITNGEHVQREQGGQSTDPCGTPQVTACVSEVAPPRHTYSVLSVRYDVNQQGGVSDSNGVEVVKEDVVVHGDECCGEVKKDEKQW